MMIGGKDLEFAITITADGRLAIRQIRELDRAVDEAGKAAKGAAADQRQLAKGVDRAAGEAAKGARDQRDLARSTGRAGDRATASARQHGPNPCPDAEGIKTELPATGLADVRRGWAGMRRDGTSAYYPAPGGRVDGSSMPLAPGPAWPPRPAAPRIIARRTGP